MKRQLVAVLALACAFSLGSCGAKSSDSSSASGGSTPAAAPASGGTVAAVSKYDAGPRAGEQPIDEARVAEGAGLFKSKGCTACHAFGKRLTCPDLAGVTMRRTAAWMENQILHPDVMVKEDPISHGLFATYALQMPNQGLTPDQAKAVVEFFKETDHEAHEKSASH